MMTPQEVASSTFPKATLGGYNMAAVDVFLDKLTEDYTGLYKENAALKAKIKVLVDKMEEYHAMEDTMRSTLLTAQKMATTMVDEAQQKADAMIADGELAAKKRKDELAEEIAAEEQRLENVRRDIDKKVEVEHERLTVAQRELGNFLTSYRKLCEKQLELIERLPELGILPADFDIPAAESAPAPQTVQEITEPAVEIPAPIQEEIEVEEIMDDEAAAAALAEVTEELGGDADTLMKSMQGVIEAFSRGETGEAEATEEVPAEKPEEDLFDIGFEDADSLFADGKEETPVSGGEDTDPFEEADATRVLNLDDLQFGRNYNKDN